MTSCAPSRPRHHHRCAPRRGCLRSTTTIDLKADGSGTILQETAVIDPGAGDAPGHGWCECSVRRQAAAALRRGAGAQGGEADGRDVRFRGADQDRRARRLSRALFASPTSRRSRSRWTRAPDSLTAGGDTRKPPFAFAFNRGPAASTLTIQMPEQTPGVCWRNAAARRRDVDADKAQAAQALAMMKMMMHGHVRRRRVERRRPHHQDATRPTSRDRGSR